MKNFVDGVARGVGMALLLAGFSATSSADGDRQAEAEIRLCSDPEVVIGEAKLKERRSSEGIKRIKIELKVEGLEPGRHAVHIHETADCVPCGEAGGHFDPGPFGMTNPDANHPFHLGDLINIEAKNDGKGKLKTETTRVTLSPGRLSIFDSDGSAFIIHDNADTYCPDSDGDGFGESGCAGGSRFACGVIVRK